MRGHLPAAAPNHLLHKMIELSDLTVCLDNKNEADEIE